MQDPKKFLVILGTMAHQPSVKFDKLFQKLYNTELWLMAYEKIAPKQGNMTPGTDGKTIDGAGCVRTENAGANMVARHSYPFMRVSYATSARAFKASNR